MSVQLTTQPPLSSATVALFPAMYRRAVRETRRIIVAVTAVPLIVPIFMLTVFSRVFSPMVQAHTFESANNYVRYVAPGAILMAVMLSATGAVSVAVERQTGFYDRMLISPRGPRGSNLGRRAADTTKLFFFALVLVVVSFVAGAGTDNWLLVLAFGTLLPALWGFAYGGFAFAVCLRTGNAQLAEVILPVFFPLLFVSSAFVPTSLLPGWMETVATYNPLTYLCDTIRNAYLGRVEAEPLALALLSIVVVGIVTQLLITRAEKKVARER